MTNLKTLNARTETLLRASTQVDKAIAHHLCEIAKHVNGKGNGDVSAVNYFWSILTAGGKSGLRHDAIGNWLIAFCGVTWNAEKKRYNRKKDFTFDLRAAEESPWYTFTKQSAFKPFDLDKALAALIKRANAALEDAEHAKEHKVNKDMLKRIEALLDPKALPKTAEVAETSNEDTDTDAEVTEAPEAQAA